ncbi:MAG: hypothetical protein RLZZ69_2530 [Cyanobacteriota bacterium]
MPECAARYCTSCLGNCRRVLAAMADPAPTDQPMPAILVSPPANEQPKATRKRGRPKLSESTDEAASWTDSMIEALLEARRTNLNLFLNAKDKKSLMHGWKKVALSFNNAMKLTIPIEKIKSKYQFLKKKYREISQAETKTTGNVKLPKKPSYYHLLVGHFGGREGMAHQCLSSNQLAALSEDDVDDESSSNEDDDAKVVPRNLIPTPASTTSRYCSLTKNSKTDNVLALLEMSDRIASALTGPQPSFNNDLQEIKQLLKEQARQQSETMTMFQTMMKALLKNQ